MSPAESQERFDFVSPARLRPLLGGLFAVVALAGCGDDPACVFGGSCNVSGGTPGALGGEAAAPVSGLWSQEGAPTVESAAPEGFGQHSQTPIVVTFSESMQFSSLVSSVLLERAADGDAPFDPNDPFGLGDQPGEPVPVLSALVGDGRVLVLLPESALVPGEYSLSIVDAPSVPGLPGIPVSTRPRDLTGEFLVVPEDSVLTTFEVGEPNPEAPTVVAVWPPDGSTNQGATGEIVVVFDRDVAPGSVTGESFAVTVNGVVPEDNPEPTMAVRVETILGVSGDPRVFSWRSVGGDGSFSTLGADATVAVTLSPESAPIAMTDGSVLAPTANDSMFQTAPFSAPLALALTSDPADSIGADHLREGSELNLGLSLSLADARGGDEVALYIFGSEPAVASEGDEPVDDTAGDIVAVRRTSIVESDGVSALFSRDALELSRDGAPIFADGSIAFAAQVVRSGVESPLTVLDADATLDGIQDVLLDTVVPTFTSFTVAGSTSSSEFRSDQRDLAVTGVASEPVRRAIVETAALGSNGMFPDVFGSDTTGNFVAASVPMGLVSLSDQPVSFTLSVLDDALNAAESQEASFTQFGGVGPEAFEPGDDLRIRAFDAVALAPVANALVVLEMLVSTGGGPSFQYQTARTDDDGIATLATPAIGLVEMSVTVDADAYDLITMFGPLTERIDFPLTATNGVTTQIAGSVSSTSPVPLLGLGSLRGVTGDSRRSVNEARVRLTDACEGGLVLGTISCGFGPYAVAPERFGALTYLAGIGTFSSSANFTAQEVLQAFVIHYPALPILQGNEGDAPEVALEVQSLLVESGIPAGSVAVEAPAVMLNIAGTGLGTLVDDPTTTGEPNVVVEAAVPGVGGSVPVGLGVAFDDGADLYEVRAAHSGLAGVGGELSARGTLEEDLFLRMELIDDLGNRLVSRPRFSAIAPEESVVLPTVPQGTSTSDLTAGATIVAAHPTFAHVDAFRSSGAPVLYALDLRASDSSGRGWSLYRDAVSDGSSSLLVLPDLDAAGGAGLPDGEYRAQMRAWSWSGLDPMAFLWSDLERDYEVFAFGAGFDFELALGM